jgi:hypothetical protein
MIRTIELHVDTFAELWKQRRPEENSEDQIIRRLLNMMEETYEPSDAIRAASEASLGIGSSDLPPSKQWKPLLVWTLQKLGGRASLADIYRVSREGRRALGYRTTPNHDASARECLESHCLESEKYRQRENLFCMPEGKGAGIWALR